VTVGESVEVPVWVLVGLTVLVGVMVGVQVAVGASNAAMKTLLSI